MLSKQQKSIIENWFWSATRQDRLHLRNMCRTVMQFCAHILQDRQEERL